MGERPCHYVRGEKGERVLIPGCWGTVHSADMRDCYCDRRKHRVSLEERIARLEEAVARLTEAPDAP